MIKVPIYDTRNKAVELNEPGDNLVINGPDTAVRSIQYQTDGLNRWAIVVNGAEGGANTGSDFTLLSADDAGGIFAFSFPFSIIRATGVATFAVRPVFGANTPWDTGNLPVAAGTWAPTVANVANTSARSATNCSYERVDGSVKFRGRLDITPTVTATVTTVSITIPVASNFGNSQDAVGWAMSQGAAAFNPGLVTADAANDRFNMTFFSTGTTSVAFNFEGSYRII